MAHSAAKLTVSAVLLTGTLVGSLVGGFAIVQSYVPWLSVRDQPEQVTTVSPGPVDAAATVSPSGPTLAESTVVQVMASTPQELAADGWEEAPAKGGVPGLSFGFGCDPTDGLAAVVAASRSWSYGAVSDATAATQSVTVTAYAYPAGGGAVAMAGVAAAVLACDAAELVPLSSGWGVESFQVQTSNSATVLWRRGDVVMAASVASHGRPGSVSTFSPVFTQYDAVLDTALDGVCEDESSTVADGFRSPYLNRKKFTGNTTTTRVSRPEPAATEPVTTASPVPVPAPSVPVPVLVSLPVAPYPPITDGPKVLPSPVSSPTLPTAPVSPRAFAAVERRVDDPTGPGCGWKFTGQVPPVFDEEAALNEFDEAVDVAEHRLSGAWARWLRAKVSYYVAYAEYAKGAATYDTYATAVLAAQAAWDVVADARAEYESALSVYDAAVQAREQWHLDRAAAREEYEQAKRDCATSTPSPSPTLPTGSPTTTPTPTPSSAPEGPAARAVLVCPPVRPAILDEVEPTVPASPVPAPEAQLPVAKP